MLEMDDKSGVALRRTAAAAIERPAEVGGVSGLRSLVELGGDHFESSPSSYGQQLARVTEEWQSISRGSIAVERPAAGVRRLCHRRRATGWILFLDIMREVGNFAVEQMEGGERLVLVYDFTRW